jgi:hypothetical protein
MADQLDMFATEVKPKPAPKFSKRDELEWATLELGETPEDVAWARRRLGLESPP